MKKFAIIGLFALVIGSLGTIFHWDQLFDLGKAKRESETKSIEADQIEKIIVDSDLAEINFYKTDSEQIDIHFSKTGSSTIAEIFTVDQSGETLQVTVDHGSRFFNLSLFNLSSLNIPFFNRKVTLNIGLPDLFSGSIEAETNVGHIKLTNLAFDHFKGTVDVGKIAGENITLNNGSAITNVGEINLKMVTGEWYLKSDVGELNLALLEWQGDIEAHSEIGDITIQLPEEPEHYSLYLETELGDIIPSSYINTNNGQGPALSATSEIGDIEIQWKD